MAFSCSFLSTAAATLSASAFLLLAGCGQEKLPFDPLGTVHSDGGPGSMGQADLSPLEQCKLTCDPDWSCDDTGACVQPVMPTETVRHHDGGTSGHTGGGSDGGGTCNPGSSGGSIGSGGKTCSYHCYGGWVCNTDTGHCVPPPPPMAGCTGGSDAGAGDAGTGGTGSDASTGGTVPTGGPIGPSGGTVDRFKFAVFGDVRPPSIDADTSYPVAIITPIIRAIQSQGAQFIMATGDYMYSRTTASVQNQLDQLLGAETSFTNGTIFHTMGNHECTGGTSSNCPAHNETPNMRGYMSRLLPFSQTAYFTFTVQTTMGSAKFVSIAANAWDSTQAAWLHQTMSQQTTYTFVARHEPTGDPQAPGAQPSDAIIDQYPVTLKMFGHAHEYRRLTTNSVISGNGGANLRTQGTYYGYLMVEQQASGNVSVTAYDVSTGMPVDSWVITPSGAAGH
jgi:hypothetical protein